MPQSWYSIRNAADEKSVEISIYEEIGFWGVTAQTFLNELKAVGKRPIVLRINSPGGSVFDGLPIYNRLREHAAGVTVKIDGLAASMASVIAMAGTRVEMSENALLMIHNPSGWADGEAEDMRQLAEVLDKIKDSLIPAYARKTGLPYNKLSKMMDEETWLTAAEAKALGFIDHISDPIAVAAKFDSHRLPKIPAHLAARLNPTTPPAMKFSAAILALLATHTGHSLTEASEPAEIENSITALGTLLAQRDADLATARASFASVAAERDTLQAQFTELSGSVEGIRTELATAQADLTTRTTERDTLTASLTRSTENIGRLEALCGVKGIDPKSAVKVTTGFVPASVIEQYRAAVDAGDEKARKELLAKHRDELFAARNKGLL